MAFSKVDNTQFHCQVPTELVTLNILRSSLDQIFDIFKGTGDPQLISLVNLTSSLCAKFVEKFYSAMTLMTEGDYRQFEGCCKARSADLDTLFKLLSTSEGGAEIYIAYQDDKQIEAQRVKFLNSNSTIFAYFEGRDEDEVPWTFSVERRPAFYSYIMVNVIRIMDAYCKHVDYDKTIANALLELAQVPLSLGRIYQELRPTQAMKLEDEKASILRMSNDHQLDKSSEFYTLFNKVAKDLEEGKLPYIREASMALRRTKQYRESPFVDEDIYISAKGTSSTVKGMQRNKSIVASLYENDRFINSEIDNVIGYSSTYNINVLDGYSNPGFRTVAIEQHKLKSRVIVIGDNALQDRCNYIHRRFSKFLDYLPSDCTRDQRKGVSFAIRVTNPSFRESKGMYDILCNDISDATGTLNQEFQKLCIELVFNPIIAEFWDKNVAKAEKTFYHCDGNEEKYVQKAGQPQGVLASFDAFAWAHHVLFLMTMKKSNLEQTLASECYRVLGDDSIAISISADPSGSFQTNYVNIANWINWKIELSKSHIVRHTDKVSSAEFAKVTVLEGRIITPVPIRLLSRMGMRKNNYYYFSTIIWMISNNYRCIQEHLDELVRYQYPDDESHRIVMTLLKGDLIPQFSELKDSRFSTESLDRSLLLLAVITSQIKGSFIEALIGDKQREALQINKFVIQDAAALLLNDKIEQFINRIENPEHKYWKMLIKNSIIEDSLRSILEIQDVSLIKGLITLEPEQENAILEVSHIIDNLEYSFTETESTMIKGLSKELSFLDGFQLRSLKKSATRQISYFEDILAYIGKFCEITNRDLSTFLLEELPTDNVAVGE